MLILHTSFSNISKVYTKLHMLPMLTYYKCLTFHFTGYGTIWCTSFFRQHRKSITQHTILSSLGSYVSSMWHIPPPHAPNLQALRTPIMPPALSSKPCGLGGRCKLRCRISALCVCGARALCPWTFHSDRACKEGAFMHSNLHLHCCKLRPWNEALGETAAHWLQGQC